MKVAVIGSRTFANYNRLEKILDKIHSKKNITLFISGHAQGADSLGEKWAIDNNIETIIFYSDWSLGRGAGFIRNRYIIEEADLVLAFWDGVSKGTKHSIGLCKKKNKKCFIIKI